MDITFTCPSCHQSLEAPTEMAGQNLACPNCTHNITIPVPASMPKKPAAVLPDEPEPEPKHATAHKKGPTIAKGSVPHNRPRAEEKKPPAKRQQVAAEGSIFDFAFNGFVTPSIIRFLYGLVFILCCLALIGVLVVAFTQMKDEPQVAVTMLFAGPISILGYLLSARVTFEFIMVVFKIEKNTRNLTM